MESKLSIERGVGIEKESQHTLRPSFLVLLLKPITRSHLVSLTRPSTSQALPVFNQLQVQMMLDLAGEIICSLRFLELA